MELLASFPELNYGKHQDIRRDYKYGDDLINPKNWSDDIKSYSGRINEYIDQRNKSAGIRSKNLREIGLPLGEVRKTMDVFQTMSGDILNNRIFINIGKTIKEQYEHYNPQVPVGAPDKKTNIVNVDRLSKEVLNFIMDISSIKNNFITGLQETVSADKIEYNTKFIKDNDYSAGRYIAENSNLSKYGLYPEIIGTDIAKVTANTDERNSVAFTSGGLFGWKFTTPQQRTIGSAGAFGSIIIDIIFKLFKIDDITAPKSGEIHDTTTAGKDKENAQYIFSIIKNNYEPLMTSNIIRDLSELNDDIEKDRNPLVMGIKRDEYRQPDIYALWCVYNSIRTPFYNRDNIEKPTLDFDTIYKLLGYTIEKNNNNNIEFKPRTLTFDSGNSNTIKNGIIKALKGSEPTKPGSRTKTYVTNKSVLLFNIENIITEFNVPVATSTSLAETSIQLDIIEKLEKLDDKSWYKIISHAVTCLYLNLFIASDVDWDNLLEKSNINSSGTIISKLEFKVNGGPQNPVRFVDKSPQYLIKIANSEFQKYRNMLETVLGFNNKNPMGGTSLMGSNPLSFEKYGSIISYPGDRNVLEGVSGYLSMILSDINLIEERLKDALENMSNMYWYRDILRWLEVLFTIFKPNDAPAGRSYSSMEIKANFFQLEKILKILYSKQLTLMIDYIQKTNMLQKRYKTGMEINKSLEKQIKMTSYHNKSTICYIKRQIKIIYHLLEKTLESWWTISPNPTMRKRRAIAPAFQESDFKPAYRIMKVSLTEWFKGEVSRIQSDIKESDLKIEIHSLSNDLCGDGNIRTEKKTPTDIYLKNDNKINIINKPNYWLEVMSFLKNKNPENISSEIKKLQRLYIPVYTKSGSKRNYFLFDIMPLILNGNYKSTFGGKSPPQWLSANDLEKTKFTKDNNGIVIIANSANEVAFHNNWQAISIEWFDNLINSANESASKTGNSDRKLWFIKTIFFMLLNSDNKRPIIYNAPSLKKETLGSNDTDLTKSGISKMRNLLQKYQEYNDINKSENNKYISLVSREYVENIMVSVLK